MADQTQTDTPQPEPTPETKPVTWGEWHAKRAAAAQETPAGRIGC